MEILMAAERLGWRGLGRLRAVTWWFCGLTVEMKIKDLLGKMKHRQK